MKQYMHHTATLKFLLQSYASTIILFAGLYTFIARVKVTSLLDINNFIPSVPINEKLRLMVSHVTLQYLLNVTKASKVTRLAVGL